MNNLQKHFCSYEVSRELKELGFNESCLSYYVPKMSGYPLRYIWEEEMNPCSNSEIFKEYVASPLISQALEFLREKYGYHIEVGFDSWATEKYDFTINKKGEPEFCYEEINFETYEQAQEAGILKAIELIKSKKV